MLNFEFFFSTERIFFASVFVFLFGLCFGSFFNVCIWRIPRGETVVSTPSHCPNCGTNIKWFDNVPILSYLILGFRCRSCKARISPKYILVELLTGILFVTGYHRIVLLGLGFPSLIMYLLAISLVILTFILDLKHHIIPDKITYTITIFALITSFVLPESVGKKTHLDGLLNSLSGMIVSLALLGSFSFIGKKIFKKEALGWGDVKYLGTIGACFGLIPAVWFFTLFIGSVIGLIFGFCLIIFKSKSIFSELPFGPFLAIGTYSWILFGPELTESYFTLLRSFVL